MAYQVIMNNNFSRQDKVIFESNSKALAWFAAADLQKKKFKVRIIEI